MLVSALGFACASAPPIEEVPSAETYYERGLEILEGRRVLLLFRDVDYPQAIELFQEVIDNYPYSEYATLAELKIADIHFRRGNHEEAASYYQDFVELHPKHPEVPYAIYRNGLCAFERIRGSDQDQNPTHDALAQFRVLLERYPDSPHVEAADAKLQEAIDHLAAHEIEVGLFYMAREDHHAAAKRFREALIAYPDHSARLDTMVQLGQALEAMRRFEEAEEVFQKVHALRAAAGVQVDDPPAERRTVPESREAPSSTSELQACRDLGDPGCRSEALQPDPAAQDGND